MRGNWPASLRGWVAADPLLREKNISASFGIACYPLHGSSPQELIQVADASMYLSKHQGGNAVSHRRSLRSNERRNGSATVLEAYLGVTLKRLFSTGPEAFEEIYQRLRQFTESIAATEPNNGKQAAAPAQGAQALPQAVLDTVTSLAFAIDAKDHYTQGHSQKVLRVCGADRGSDGDARRRNRRDSPGRHPPRHWQGWYPGEYSE